LALFLWVGSTTQWVNPTRPIPSIFLRNTAEEARPVSLEVTFSVHEHSAFTANILAMKKETEFEVEVIKQKITHHCKVSKQAF